MEHLTYFRHPIPCFTLTYMTMMCNLALVRLQETLRSLGLPAGASEKDLDHQSMFSSRAALVVGFAIAGEAEVEAQVIGLSVLAVSSLVIYAPQNVQLA